MQIYAYDDEGQEQVAHLAAQGAEKTGNYWCLECHERLALRSGPFVRSHFYHLKSERPCRHRAKTATHLEIQSRLLQLLPPGEAKSEVHFPKISRIADLVWEKEKIIFEVQVSFITYEEVASRNQAYGSLGYQVVWILHESRFNRRRVTAAEASLLSSPHYYTDIDARGVGSFYDQFSYHFKGQRVLRLFRRPVDLNSPLREGALLSLPPLMAKARMAWPLYFEGDIRHRPPTDPYHLNRAYEMEKKLLPETLLQKLRKKIRRAVKFVGYLILQSAVD